MCVKGTIVTSVSKEPVEIRGDVITQEMVMALNQATRSQNVQHMPLTFSTIYRLGEFEWVKRLGIDLRDLLHILWGRNAD